MRLIVLLRHLPVAVAAVVALAEPHIARHAALQQEGTLVDPALDIEAIPLEVRRLRPNLLHRKQRPAGEHVHELAALTPVEVHHLVTPGELQCQPVLIREQRAILDHLVLVIHELPGPVVVDPQPLVRAHILPEANVIVQQIVIFRLGDDVRYIDIGQCRLINVAIRRVPVPHEIAVCHVRMLQEKLHIRLPVAVEIIEGEVDTAVADLRKFLRKVHAVHHLRLELVPEKRRAHRVHRRQHRDALPVPHDRALADHHPGRPPVLPRDIVTPGALRRFRTAAARRKHEAQHHHANQPIFSIPLFHCPLTFFLIQQFLIQTLIFHSG